MLTKRTHDKGMKMIMDMVFNHAGSETWFVKIRHKKTGFISSRNTRIPIIVCRSARIHTLRKLIPTKCSRVGSTVTCPIWTSITNCSRLTWFRTASGGLNMHSSMASGWTHPYPYKDFMSTWCKTVLDEYPNFNIVGEVWEERVLLTSYFQRNSTNTDGYQGNLPSITDFPLKSALNTAFNERDGWEEGLLRIYYVLIQDFAYTEPNNNVIFLDNHDITRFATSVGGDINKQKMGFAVLLTLRGIPQMFYGGEIGMPGDGGNHGKAAGGYAGRLEGRQSRVSRKPGVQPARTSSFSTSAQSLTGGNRSRLFTTASSCTSFRRTASMFTSVHRYRERDGDSEQQCRRKTLTTQRFNERLQGFNSAENIVTKQTVSNFVEYCVASQSATILELKSKHEDFRDRQKLCRAYPGAE